MAVFRRPQHLHKSVRAFAPPHRSTRFLLLPHGNTHTIRLARLRSESRQQRLTGTVLPSRYLARVIVLKLFTVAPLIRTPILQGGKHSILLMPLAETEQRKFIGEFFEAYRPMDPDVFARRLLDRVARNEGTIVIPGWWKLLWWLDRLLPGACAFGARRRFERDRRRLADRLANMPRSGS